MQGQGHEVSRAEHFLFTMCFIQILKMADNSLESSQYLKYVLSQPLGYGTSLKKWLHDAKKRPYIAKHMNIFHIKNLIFSTNLEG